MNAFEFFFAEPVSYSGYEDSGEEVTTLLPSYENKLAYFHMTAKGEKYFYEYLILSPRNKEYEWFYSHLKMELEDLPDEKQYEIIQRMKTMEIEFVPEISYDELNCWYHVRSATYQKYPCDTSEVENDINRWSGVVSQFYF